MASLTINHIDDAVYERLERDAEANHRSVEAEARHRLEIVRVVDNENESLTDYFRRTMVNPGPGYEGSVALIRRIRDEE